MKKKLRIVFNTWSGAMFQRGGGEVQLFQTKKALEDLGHEVILFDQWNPVTDVDLLHQFSTDVGVEHVVRKYRELGIPVALSTILWNFPGQEHFQYWRYKWLMENSQVMMTNSDVESQRLSEHLGIPLEKFIKTRNSISTAYLAKATGDRFRVEFGIKDKFVLSVANIDRRKNTKLLAQSCERLGAQLVLIGHVKDQNYFDESRAVGPSFRHLGPIEDEEILKSAYAACDVFALPSLCETPGIAALEAAAQGAKIVITSEGSTTEYFGDEAVYVNPLDDKSIEQGLAQALAAARPAALAGRILNEYTWARTAEEVLAGYELALRMK